MAAFIGVWEIFARTQSPLIIAPFSDVVISLGGLVVEPSFQAAYLETMRPFAIGLALAIVIGIPLGLVIGINRYARSLILPYVNFVNAVPMTAFIPLVVIGLGIGLGARVAVVFLFSIPDIVLSSAAGVRYLNADLVDMGRSFGASRFRIMRRIVLPSSLPGVMAGLRLGAGRAVIGMVASELLLVSVGMGAVISRFRGFFDTKNLYAAVLVLALTGIVTLAIVQLLERRVLHWQFARDTDQ